MDATQDTEGKEGGGPLPSVAGAARLLPGFGFYARIEQKRYGATNEFYEYKIIGRGESNCWRSVPVALGEGEHLRETIEPVVHAICCGVAEETVERFRIADLASWYKAPEGEALPSASEGSPSPSPSKLDLEAMFPTLRRELAELCHEQWSGWMRYLFEKCEMLPNEPRGELAVMPEWAVQRWKRQMQTPYAELSDSEKESDLKEADRFMAIFARRLRGDKGEG